MTADREKKVAGHEDKTARRKGAKKKKKKRKKKTRQQRTENKKGNTIRTCAQLLQELVRAERHVLVPVGVGGDKAHELSAEVAHTQQEVHVAHGDGEALLDLLGGDQVPMQHKVHERARLHILLHPHGDLTRVPARRPK